MNPSPILLREAFLYCQVVVKFPRVTTAVQNLRIGAEYNESSLFAMLLSRLNQRGPYIS